jgi:hypothetical protein
MTACRDMSNRQQTKCVHSVKLPFPTDDTDLFCSNRWCDTEALGTIPGGPSDTGISSRPFSWPIILSRVKRLDGRFGLVIGFIESLFNW